MKLFIRLTAGVAFLVFFIYAALFYKERTLSFDVALQDFYIIVFKKSFVVWLRAGALAPQIFPVILRWLQCPLKDILLAHSLGLVIFHLSIFSIITFVFRQHWVALSFLLFLVLLVNDTFYWIPSEIPQGIGFLFLYYAWLEKSGSASIHKHPVVHFVLLLFIQFMHPLMLAPILFVVLYAIYKTYKVRLSAYLAPVSMVVISFVFRYYAGRKDWYEGPKLNLAANITSNGPHFFQLSSVQQLMTYATNDYIVYSILFAVTVMVLIALKRFCITALLVLFTSCYVVIVCIANPVANKFYLENMLLPISLFLLLPFTDVILKRVSGYRPFLRGLVLSIITIRLISIYQAHTVYTNRLTWFNNEFKKMERDNIQKLILYPQDVPVDTLVMTWAAGYESLLLSSIEGPDKAKAIVIDNHPYRFGVILQYDTILLPEWGWGTSPELKEKYFNLNPGNYIIRGVQ